MPFTFKGLKIKLSGGDGTALSLNLDWFLSNGIAYEKAARALGRDILDLSYRDI